MASSKLPITRNVSKSGMNRYMPGHEIPDTDFITEYNFVTRQMQVEQVPPKTQLLNLYGAAINTYVEPLPPPITGNKLLPFDTAIVTYTWTQFGGYDLDTRTSIQNSGTLYDGLELGFFRPVGAPLSGTILNPNSSGSGLNGQVLGPTGASTSSYYLYWGGDNLGPYYPSYPTLAQLTDPPTNAFEACIINYKKFITDFSSLVTFDFLFKAYWYDGSGSMTSHGGFSTFTGAIALSFTTYLGGTYSHNSSTGNFSNSGGTLVQNISFNTNTFNTRIGVSGGITDPSLNGSILGRVRFNVLTNTVTFLTS